MKKRGNITLTYNVYSNKAGTTPDYRGKLTVDGIDLDVSLWINRDIQGVPVHLSGQISERENNE